MNTSKDEHLSWFLFKTAFKLFGISMLWAFIALIDEEGAAEGLKKLIQDIIDGSEINDK